MKSLRFTSILAATLLAFGGMMQSCDDDDNNDTDLVTVNAKYETALKAIYPDVTGVTWESSHGYQVAEFTKNFTSYEVWFDSSTSVAMTKYDYGKNLFLVMDNSVNSAFASGEYGTWTVDDIARYVRADDEFYVFEVEKAGSEDMDLYYDTEGTLLKAVPESSAPDILPDTTL